MSDTESTDTDTMPETERVYTRVSGMDMPFLRDTILACYGATKKDGESICTPRRSVFSSLWGTILDFLKSRKEEDEDIRWMKVTKLFRTKVEEKLSFPSGRRAYFDLGEASHVKAFLSSMDEVRSYAMDEKLLDEEHFKAENFRLASSLTVTDAQQTIEPLVRSLWDRSEQLDLSDLTILIGMREQYSEFPGTALDMFTKEGAQDIRGRMQGLLPTYGDTMRSALKVIRLPSNSSDIGHLQFLDNMLASAVANTVTVKRGIDGGTFRKGVAFDQDAHTRATTFGLQEAIHRYENLQKFQRVPDDLRNSIRPIVELKRKNAFNELREIIEEQGAPNV